MESALSCSNNSLNKEKEKEIETYSEKCELLQMLRIPTFGKYKEDYTFLEQVLALKSETKPDNLPEKLNMKLDELKKNHPEAEQEFFHITLSTNNFLSPTSEKEVNSSYTLLNLLAHPYIFYDCKLDKQKKHESQIFCAAFTDEAELDTIKEEDQKDKEKLKINPDCRLDSDELKRDIILHLNHDGYTSLSPNNCGILVNLNAQIINFYVVVCGTFAGKIVKCFVGNFVIIPNANNSVLFGELYNKMVKEKSKENLTTELIIFKNKYSDYMNYIFNYGINEIVTQAKNLNDIKLCIKKAFSLIYDFSINGDEDDQNMKKIHEKELMSMQNYYYDNVCHFIKNLYKFSEFENNFGEKLLESSLKKNFVEELLLKYILFSIKRINQIILNYEFFIYENDDALARIQENADEQYSEDILPNLKSLIADLLSAEEEKIDEIKDIYSEENRVHKNNPNIETLINICNAVRNEDDIAPVLNELDDLMKTYLFYIVWIYKGKPCGIHDDFGRVSFMNETIKKEYFCNDDDKINCCQQLIEYLENADDKKY